MRAMVESIGAHVDRVREGIAAACGRSGRAEQEIWLMAVTKNQPWSSVEAAYAAGIRLFGENRVQEAAEKYTTLPHGAELHLVGHLQRNKAKEAVSLFSAVHSIDKAATAKALAKRVGANDARYPVLLEINSSGEESKQGVRTEAELWSLLDSCLEMDTLTVRGLMTIAPFTSDETVLRRAFRHVRSLREQARQRYPELDLAELSMGMSNDYEIAIEEGATTIRLGTVLFGARDG